jgi:transposase
MTLPPRFGLSETERDALLMEQAAMIEHLVARIAALEAIVGKPRQTSSNYHKPPYKDGPGQGRRPKRPARKHPPRSGRFRPLAQTPGRTERYTASACVHCGNDVSMATQQRWQSYDHIDLPPVRPLVTRAKVFGERCGDCGRRYRGETPTGMVPGAPFGRGIRSLL